MGKKEKAARILGLLERRVQMGGGRLEGEANMACADLTLINKRFRRMTVNYLHGPGTAERWWVRCPRCKMADRYVMRKGKRALREHLRDHEIMRALGCEADWMAELPEAGRPESQAGLRRTALKEAP